MDPCIWEPLVRGTVSVANGQNVSGANLIMLKGVEYEIAVADSTKVLQRAQETKSSGAGLIVGVLGPNGLFRPARIKARSETSRTYSVTVPFERPVRLMVKGRRLVLEDNTGQRVALNDPLKVYTEPESTNPTARQFTYTIRGLEP
jgi:hypothetical protein